MTLTTHAIIGATAASLLPTHPILGGLLAFGSHFVLDAIPHWDYKIYSDYSTVTETQACKQFGLRFLFDLFKTGIDATLGLLLAFLFLFSFASVWIILIGAILAMLPDFLYLVESRFYFYPIRLIQRFHDWIHARLHLHNPLTGVILQIAVIFIVIGIRLKI